MVHILTRNPSSAIAQVLQFKGAILHIEDLGSPRTLQAALQTVTAIFLAIPADPISEITQASTPPNQAGTTQRAHWRAFSMQNFCRPEVEHMFAGVSDEGAHELRVAFHRQTRLDLIDVSEVARFAAAALDAPEGFSGSGEGIRVECLDDGQAMTLKEQGHVAVEAQLWQRDVGCGVDSNALKRYGIRLTPLAEALDRDALAW
ncbi:hypothetical protein K491DRAFT_768967 [Lophiostoma macrostomum CBS 122681]|uniref:NmrA-like domain-containing protein n=1 Tax=Lophiostoma macrostomum CBS 122681 TaxID=1314788 RepID=A0A6A6T3H0_9PLEO|nr:hypothetical protein K491DRAFT_768967 [Lophiostoma macrostomum CBS 122681]